MRASCFLLAVFLATVVAFGQEAERPKIGLVLSGGGARGVAHIGVLQALEELRVPVDYIAGTSMGAVVGGLYASGMAPAEIEAFFRSTDWQDVLRDAPPRAATTFRQRSRVYELNQDYQVGVSARGVQLPAGVIAGEKLVANLHRLLLPVQGVRDFDRLPIPFRAVATDLETGAKAVLSEGDLALAIRASMAVPGVFSPIERDGRLLVDGGISSNLPISTVRAMGADVVIAVDVRGDLRGQADLQSPLAIANQMLDILIQRDSVEQLKSLTPRDVYIRLPLPGASSAGFAGSAANIAPGFEGAMERAGALRKLSEAAADYRRYLAGQRLERAGEIELRFLEIASQGKVTTQRLATPEIIEPGEAIDFAWLERQVAGQRVRGDFRVSNVRIVERDGQRGLSLVAADPPGGRNFINFGFNADYSSTDETDTNLLLSYRMTELNSLGAEWQTFVSLGSTGALLSEWYQPVEPSRTLFVAPRLDYLGDFVDGRDGAGERIRFRRNRVELGLDTGTRIGTAGEVRLGYAAGRGRVGRTVGFGRARNYDIGYVHAAATWDTLDDPAFPRNGLLVSGDVALSREVLGASDDYARFSGEAYAPFTVGETTLVPRVSAGLALDGNGLPIYERFPLGGLFNLSGLARGELYDENSLVGGLIVYRRLGVLVPGVGGALYGGFSAEAGTVWGTNSEFGDLTLAGSVFLGTRTILGPAFLGVGATSEGNAAVYLQLGSLFSK